MSEDLAEGNSTSHKAELEIEWEYYGRFVNVVDYKLKIDDVKEDVDVKKSGIYKLIPENHPEKRKPELYIGEAQNILKRLNNYTNAGYVLNADREYTNRRIQGWMHDLNKMKNGGGVKIFVCTEAPYLCQDGEKLWLDLSGETNGKYNRELIEHIEIANSANKFRIQNDPCNWKKNQDKC